jgi:hypothetical protein
VLLFEGKGFITDFGISFCDERMLKELPEGEEYVVGVAGTKGYLGNLALILCCTLS